MRFLARALFLLVLALPVLAIATIWLCIEDAPAIERSVQLTPQDIENARRIIDQHDPGKGRPGRPRTLTLSEQDLDLMLNYAASRFGGGAARASLRPGVVRLQGSVEIPRSPFGRYLNVDAALREAGTLPRLEYLRVGRLSVPPVIADLLVREGIAWMVAGERGELAADIVKGVSVAEGRVTVTYVWSGEIESRVRAVLLSADDQARLRAYHDRLVETAARAPAKVSLAALMPPLFDTVLERGGESDVARESRAAIVVLAFYAGGIGLAAIAPAAAQWAPPARRTVTLAGRDDFPKHFLISAAIAATAGSPLSDAIGVYKEIDDSRGGSGFSFNDIGADRAGTRFGEIASRSPERARQLAVAVASGVRESDFMPDVADLPEFMSEAEFERRYGGVGGAEYNRIMAKIDARVASRPLLRQPR